MLVIVELALIIFIHLSMKTLLPAIFSFLITTVKSAGDSNELYKEKMELFCDKIECHRILPTNNLRNFRKSDNETALLYMFQIDRVRNELIFYGE